MRAPEAPVNKQTRGGGAGTGPARERSGCTTGQKKNQDTDKKRTDSEGGT
jgi:hypothetical protein